MTDELVMRIPGTCDSYQVVPETWNRPGKLWVITVEIDENKAYFCAVYADTIEDAAELASKKHYPVKDYDNAGDEGYGLQLFFDENGVSNAWVW
jgi:hypothetical protein